MKNSCFCCLALLCLFSAVQGHNDRSKKTAEKRIVPTDEPLGFFIVRTSDRDKIGSLGGDPIVIVEAQALMLCNSALCELVEGLNMIYRDLGIEITDRTDYSEPVDIILETQLSDMQSLRNALRIYDLDIVPMDEICKAGDEAQELMSAQSEPDTKNFLKS